MSEEVIIVDLIACAIYEANDADYFDIEDCRTAARQVLEALREAGLDILAEFDAYITPPQPLVTLRRKPTGRRSDDSKAEQLYGYGGTD